MRLLAVLAILAGLFVPGFASQILSLQVLVLAAEKRKTYVAVVVPAISSNCLEKQWRQKPPPVLRDWFAALMLSDLENRARVLHGYLTKQQAEHLREDLFFSLQDLQPGEFEAVASYAKFSPGVGFGPKLFEVFDCQYSGLGKALRQLPPAF